MKNKDQDFYQPDEVDFESNELLVFVDNDKIISFARYVEETWISKSDHRFYALRDINSADKIIDMRRIVVDKLSQCNSVQFGPLEDMKYGYQWNTKTKVGVLSWIKE